MADFYTFPIYTISQSLLTHLDSLGSFVGQMLSNVSGVATVAAVFAIAYVGIRLILGYGSFNEALGIIMKIMFVFIMLGTSSYGYEKLIIPGINGTKNFFVDSIEVTPIQTNFNVPFTDKYLDMSKDLYGRLDLIHISAEAIYKKSSTDFNFREGASWMKLLTGFICTILGLIASFLLAFMLLGTELFLRLLFIIGPFFIFLYLFQSTRNYTFLWISNVTSNVLLFALSSIVTAISVKLLYTIIITNPANSDNVLSLLFGICIYMLVLIKVALDLPSLASSLSGGSSAGAGASSIASAAVGGVAGAVTAGFKKLITEIESKNDQKNPDGTTRSPSKSPLMLAVSTFGTTAALGANYIADMPRAITSSWSGPAGTSSTTGQNNNTASAAGTSSTTGQNNNTASAAGRSNTIGQNNNTVSAAGTSSTIGQDNNTVSAAGRSNTIGQNNNTAAGTSNTIGQNNNTASAAGTSSTIGQNNNTASAAGTSNTIGQNNNTAAGTSSTIGQNNNTASAAGTSSTTGQNNNTASAEGTSSTTNDYLKHYSNSSSNRFQPYYDSEKFTNSEQRTIDRTVKPNKS